MSGLNSQFGYGVESAWGTGVTVDTFLPFTTGAATYTAQRVQGQGIFPGAYGPLASQYAQATSAGVGELEVEVQTLGMLPLFELLMGADATSAQQAATAAYLHTMALGDPAGKSVTCQVGRAPAGLAAVPATLTGCKIVRASFSIGQTDNLSMSASLDAKAWDNTTALEAVSVPTATRVYGFQTLTVKGGTYGSEASINGVRGVSFDIERTMDTERYYAGAAGVKAEPNLSDLAAIGGSISADWLAKTTFEDLAAGMTGTSLVFEFVGAVIESTYYNTIRFTFPGAYFEPDSQGVTGPSNLQMDWPWTWKFDGTNLPKIEVISTETSV